MKEVSQRRMTIALSLVFIVVAGTAMAAKDGVDNRKALREEAKIEHAVLRDAAKQERTEARESAKEDRTEARVAQFCEKAADNADKVSDRIVKGEARIEERFTRHNEKNEEHKAKKLVIMEKNRTLADTRRDAHYAELLTRATTDEQKDAVAAYKIAVEAAVSDQRTDIDTAFTAFWDGVIAKTDEQKEAYLAAYEKFATDVETLTTTAQAECTDSDDPKDTAKDLRSALKDLHEQFRSDRSDAKDLKEEIIALRAVFHDVRDESKKTFRATVADARDALKEVFGTLSIETDAVDNDELEEDE